MWMMFNKYTTMLKISMKVKNRNTLVLEREITPIHYADFFCELSLGIDKKTKNE